MSQATPPGLPSNVLPSCVQVSTGARLVAGVALTAASGAVWRRHRRLREGIEALVEAAGTMPWPAGTIDDDLLELALSATRSDSATWWEDVDDAEGTGVSTAVSPETLDAGHVGPAAPQQPGPTRPLGPPTAAGWRGALARATDRRLLVRVDARRSILLQRSWRRPPYNRGDADVLAALLAMAQASRVAARRETLLRRQMSTDALTGLSSHPRFREEVRELVADCVAGQRWAMLDLDLDHFKTLNTRLGHLDADAVLRKVGQRILAAPLPAARSGRFGGDEFLVAFPVGAGGGAVDAAVAALTGSIRRPMRIGEQLVQVNVSVGSAIADAGVGRPEDIDAIIHQAEVAMRAAKRSSESHGPPRWVDERRRVRELLDEREIRVHYQPVVEVCSGLIVGFEALLRVTDPQLGVISPETLVDSAARVRMLDELTLLISEQALGLMREIAPHCSRRLRLNLNLEFEQLRRDNVTLSWLVEEFTDAPVDLLLELSERHSLDWTEAHADVARGLQRNGIALGIDDFGAGYATYRFLDAWRWAVVKIDRALVGSHDRHGQLLIRHIATLLHELDVPAVAEGVEDADQLAMLADLGIRYAQGYHLGRPMSATDLLDTALDGGLDRPVT